MFEEAEETGLIAVEVRILIATRRIPTLRASRITFGGQPIGTRS